MHPSSPRSTRVAINADSFASGFLPSICVVSGEPATEMVPKKVESPVGVAWLGLALGVIPFVIIRAITSREIHGGIPYNKAAARKEPAYVARRRAFLLSSFGALAGGVACALLAETTLVGTNSGGQAWLVFGAIFLLAVALFTLLFGLRQPLRWLGATYDEPRRIVTLRRTHPRFAEAVLAGPPSPWPTVQVAPTPGWHPDPSGRFPRRYWDGRAWTAHVESNGTPGHDPI